MTRTTMPVLTIAALAVPGAARAHEGYHTVFTHLDPFLAAAIMWLVFGIPLVLLAIRALAGKSKRMASLFKPRERK